MTINGTLEELVLRARGINPESKRAYVSLFNSNPTRERGTKVIEDLLINFKYYGGKPTKDAIELATRQGHREVIEYILAMSARVSDDTLAQIEKFINR